MASMHESTNSSLNESRQFPDLWPRFNRPKGYLRVLISTVDEATDGSEALLVGGDARHAAVASPEFCSGRYGARRLGFSSSKWSERQGDPYPGVLDGGLGS
jgi:hypothetical protein